MKLQSSVFRKKNSKRGLALSTAMVICIVLAILVAALVSMASLNITTTQNAISQREAYITAKSALAFAESYYSQHDVPGKDDPNGGSAVILFKDTVVSNGGEIYVTKGATNTVNTATVENMKKSKAYKVYVDVEKTGEYFDLTANCKYNSGSIYRLSKEFSFGEGSEVQPNSFNGNVCYPARNDARYLRIHVHTSSAFGKDGESLAPYVWTYMNTVNPNDGLGKSQIVNKLSQDSFYPSDTQGLSWDGGGIKGNSSVFEGNGWYMTELVFNSDQEVNYVNAIVAKNGAKREDGVKAQSWEFFGIPVPPKNQTGIENGLDVYINLNRNCLRDYQNYEYSGEDWTKGFYTYNSGTDDKYHDGLTNLFEHEYGSNMKEFAKYSGSWYTVSTKKEFVSTMHYRKQGVYDTSANPGGGFQYEGYGWWRKMSYNPGDTIKGKRFDEANLISYNKYTGGEQVREGYVCEFSDGSIGLYSYEQDANEAFANGVNGQPGEGEKAGDYLTVNVRASTAPVDNQIPTTIKYIGTKRDDSITPVAKSGDEELTFKKLSDWERNFAVIGSFNNWGRDPGAGKSDPHFYDKLSGYEMSHEGSEYVLEIPDLDPGSYEFKIIEMKDTSGSIDDKRWDGKNGWAYAYPSENEIGYIVNGGDGLRISFTWDGYNVKNIQAVEVPASGPVDSSQEFAVIGWLNDGGKSGGSRVGQSPYMDAAYGGTDKMVFDEASQCYIYRTDPARNTVVSGEEYAFKIINVTGKGDDEIIGGDGWNNSFGSDGKVDYGGGKSNDGSDVSTVKGTSASNYVFYPPTIDGDRATYILEIVFNSKTRKITVNPHPTGLGNMHFYIIGSNNNWADGTHSFNKATSSIYELEATGTTDTKGRFLYKYTTKDNLEPGDCEIKIISGDSLASGMTGDENNSIDYTKCWGDFGDTTDNNYSRDGDGQGYKFTLTKPTQVEFVFAYDAGNTVCCPISHTEVSSADIKYVTIKFKNAKGKDSSNNDTEFNRWDKLYLTYTRAGTLKCTEITFTPGTAVINCQIPKDAENFYFSNMYINDDTDPNYQRTKTIVMKTSLIGKVLLPIKRDAAENEWWSIEPEGSGVPDATEMDEKTANMVYVGSMQCNYYDAPIVKLLVEIVHNDTKADQASTYAFSAYPYPNYKVKAGDKQNITFDSNKHISYQGEVYYYAAGESLWGYSFLIVEDSSGDNGGYLLENHMALTSGEFGAAESDKKYLNMDNRAGAVIVSSDTYYDKSSCAINFGDYTPNWYTYKIPCASTVRISEIRGVTSSSDVIFSSGSKFSPARINQYANTQLYISQDKEGYEGEDEQTKEKFYTYNPSIANVDTDENGKVSIYFDNAGSAEERFTTVAVYAYNPYGDEDVKEDLSPDNTDGNTGYSYYKYSFEAGKYCYFVFYDPTTGNHETATKKTERLFLTGNENVDTHECDILAIGNGADRFVPYIHPKSQAMYAFNTLDAAWRGCQIPADYSYDGRDKTYTANSKLNMSKLEAMRNAAKAYYEGSGPWKSDKAADYSNLALEIQRFVTALINARTYIAQDVSTISGVISGPRIFKEGSYRDDTFAYQDRWVNALEDAYNQAISVYNGDNPSQVSITDLQNYRNQINQLIESPILDWNPNSVQIIVDDQVVKIGEDEDGNPKYGGGWGKNNIHLYNCATGGYDWKLAGFDLLDTTQSSEGFYAYAFKLEKYPDPYYMIGQSKPEENDRNYKELFNGKRYIFHTATGKFEADDSIMTYKITYDRIALDDPATTSYSWFSVRDAEDKCFAIQFLYDTTISCGIGDYKVYAGVYTINSSYPGFNSDISGTRGIDLFSMNAMNYFTDPKNYGMSSAESNSYSDWTENQAGTNNIDIMTSKISKSSSISARTSESRKIAFRYQNVKDHDTLKLKQKVELEGGTVSIAANKIDLDSYDFIIKAKTVVFLTDTTIVTKNNGTVVVRHGTYSFNKTESEDDYTVSLQSTGADPDWRDHYTLISGTSTTLRRGRYITHE